ncbi:MAG: hypothetical protein RLZZ124_176 [Cyanobacteriota bacterium]|jgi:hypothetical protein
MVSLEHLEALDLLLWLRSTDRAAGLASTNQSTISRRSRSVLERFGVAIRRGVDGWCDSGDPLLALERRIHQRVRLTGRQPLRLQVPHWTRCGALRQLPRGWCANPLAAPVCDNPLQLLRARVIDACLLTPTQIPALADDLLVVDLHRSLIQLTLLPLPDDHADPRSRLRRLREGAGLRLQLLPFLPGSCRRRSEEWFRQLRPGVGATSPSTDAGELGVAFLTPEMRAAQPDPWVVEHAFTPLPYVERLVVLSEHRSEPAVLQLIEQLERAFAEPLAA